MQRKITDIEIQKAQEIYLMQSKQFIDRLNFAKNYVFSGDKCFNSKTNREIKQVYNNGSIL